MDVFKSTNHCSVAKLFNDSMAILWPDGIQYNKVLLFVTDAAPYMIKAGAGLQVLYEKMIHLTCLAHAMHRVAEKVREIYPNVNSIISDVKKIVCKAPYRIQIFRETAQEVPLPPEPVITRWGTWLSAAEYYATYFDIIKAFVNKLNKHDALCIQSAQDAFNTKEVRAELLFVLTNFVRLAKVIQKLESQGNSLDESLEHVKLLGVSLNKVKGPKGLTIKQKFKSVIDKNPGFHLIKSINDALSGQDILDELKHYSLVELNNFKYAPITSCDVERSFSKYKTIFRDNRHMFTFENLKMYVIVNCNALCLENIIN